LLALYCASTAAMSDLPTPHGGTVLYKLTLQINEI